MKFWELTKRAFVSIRDLFSLPSHLGSLQPILLSSAQVAAEPMLANLEVRGASHSASQIWKFVSRFENANGGDL